MNSVTIIMIVVIALLTTIIFGLTWLAYGSCIKAYGLEVRSGKYDETIRKEYLNKKAHKNAKVKDVIGIISSYVILSALAALFAVGITYKARGENFTFQNKTALVIKSGSMSDFYNDELANQYQEYNYDTSLQFDVGDICIFEKVSKNAELVEGEVYGYRYKNIIITHRLINTYEGSLYEFRGDNNPIPDGVLVLKESVLYHYTGQKIPGVGSFILYAQSYFGLWSLSGIIGVLISSEIVYYMINKINKERAKLIPSSENESKAKNIKAQFTRKDGTLVTIYDRQEGENDEK